MTSIACIATPIKMSLYGVEKSSMPERNLRDVMGLTARLEVLPVDEQACTHWEQRELRQAPTISAVPPLSGGNAHAFLGSKAAASMAKSSTTSLSNNCHIRSSPETTIGLQYFRYSNVAIFRLPTPADKQSKAPSHEFGRSNVVIRADERIPTQHTRSVTCLCEHDRVTCSAW